MDPQRSVAVFTRHPSPGKVKTRLAATIGDSAACAFYRLCSESVLHELVQCEDTVVNLFVAEDKESGKVEDWMSEIGLKIRVKCQLQSENLGDRIFHSLKQLKLSGYFKVAAVATDIPDIAHDIIEKGMSLLDTYDAVLGPAVDGGFYFLGVKDVSKELFDGVEWSTSTVFNKMVSNFQKCNFSLAPVNSLPPIADIDTYEDLKMWMGCCEGEVEEVVHEAMERLRIKRRF